MNVPFIGITDFFLPEQVNAMLEIAKKYNQPGQAIRKLGVGVMISPKTIQGMSAFLAGAFPKREAIAKIFLADPLLFNVLHFADYLETDFYHNLEQTVSWGGPNLQAIQLDMLWPSTKVLRDFRESYPGIKLILQVGVNAFKAIANNPLQLLEKLETYRHSLDYVLLDKSMGRGLPMDPDFLMPFLSILTEKRPKLGLVIGGGLGPDSVNALEPILKKFPDISWDAEGQLRSSGKLTDPIEWDRAGTYLEKSFQKVRRESKIESR